MQLLQSSNLEPCETFFLEEGGGLGVGDTQLAVERGPLATGSLMWGTCKQVTHFRPMGSERKLGIQGEMFHSNEQGELPTFALNNFSHAQSFYVS